MIIADDAFPRNILDSLQIGEMILKLLIVLKLTKTTTKFVQLVFGYTFGRICTI